MATRSDYIDYLTEWMAPLGEIGARAMFGGHCLYCDGIVFAIVADQTLYLKADAATRGRFEALGLKPFRPYPERPEVMQFYPPLPEFFEDPDVMLDWGRAAVEAGRRARKKPPRKRH